MRDAIALTDTYAERFNCALSTDSAAEAERDRSLLATHPHNQGSQQ